MPSGKFHITYPATLVYKIMNKDVFIALGLALKSQRTLGKLERMHVNYNLGTYESLCNCDQSNAQKIETKSNRFKIILL